MSASDELIAAAQAVVDRWDTPLWKNAASTVVFIERLRRALMEQSTDHDRLDAERFRFLQALPPARAQAFFWNYGSRKRRAEAIDVAIRTQEVR